MLDRTLPLFYAITARQSGKSLAPGWRFFLPWQGPGASHYGGMNQVRRFRIIFLISVSSIIPAPGREAMAQVLWEADYREAPPQRLEWQATHDLEDVRSGPEGIEFHSTGTDPYSIGPEIVLPVDQPLFLEVTVLSSRSGSAQIFYFEDHPTENNSVRFTAVAGEWVSHRVALPSLFNRTRLRFDPPAGEGKTILGSLRLVPRTIWNEPDYRLDPPPPVGQAPFRLGSGDVEVIQSRSEWNNTRFSFRGRIVAATHPEFRIIIRRKNGIPTSFIPSELAAVRRSIGIQDFRIFSDWSFRDPDGDLWVMGRTIEELAGRPGFRIRTAIEVSAPKMVFHLPGIRVFLPKDTIQTDPETSQAVFPGLEYLSSEESSSEKDLVGPAAWRKIPAAPLVTWPMMSVVRNGCHVSLNWLWKDGEATGFSPIFDSPDRLFGTGGHVMGLVFPANRDLMRPEGGLMPYEPVLLEPGEALDFEVDLILDEAESVVPPIRDHVLAYGLPPLPSQVPDFDTYARTAAWGWLDSVCRSESGYHHAVWMGRFGAVWPLDVPIFQRWLSRHAPGLDSQSRERLEQAADEALQRWETGNRDQLTIGHIGGIWPALVHGSWDNVVEGARRKLTGQIQSFDSGHRVPVPVDGTAGTGQRDLAETHDSNSTNGYTALTIANCIELALFTGDRDSLDIALGHLDAMQADGLRVPRGAQPWEIPLHTPDILASAHMVRAFAMGYVATGDRTYLSAAQECAWTGVPFVYLRQPVDGSIGVYSTIPVFGATHYVAPVWIGMPVQWCGLVYAHSLYQLNALAPDPIWKKLADGITLAGMQHTWPLTPEPDERAGLLPDYVELIPQLRDGPAINPGTLQINVPQLFNSQPFHPTVVPEGTGAAVITGAHLTDSVTREDGSHTLRLEPALGFENLCIVHHHDEQRPATVVFTPTVDSGGDFSNPVIHESPGFMVIRVSAPMWLNLTPPSGNTEQNSSESSKP